MKSSASEPGLTLPGVLKKKKGTRLLFYFVSFVRRGKLNTEKPKWDRGKEMA